MSVEINEFNTCEDYFRAIMEEHGSYDDQETYLKDVCYHGCQSGMVSELIYYSQTTDVYNRFADELEDYFEELLESTGMRPDELFTDWEYSVGENSRNINTVVWSYFEKIARDVYEELTGEDL